MQITYGTSFYDAYRYPQHRKFISRLNGAGFLCAGHGHRRWPDLERSRQSSHQYVPDISALDSVTRNVFTRGQVSEWCNRLFSFDTTYTFTTRAESVVTRDDASTLTVDQFDANGVGESDRWPTYNSRQWVQYSYSENGVPRPRPDSTTGDLYGTASPFRWAGNFGWMRDDIEYPQPSGADYEDVAPWGKPFDYWFGPGGDGGAWKMSSAYTSNNASVFWEWWGPQWRNFYFVPLRNNRVALVNHELAYPGFPLWKIRPPGSTLTWVGGDDLSAFQHSGNDVYTKPFFAIECACSGSPGRLLTKGSAWFVPRPDDPGDYDGTLTLPIGHGMSLTLVRIDYESASPSGGWSATCDWSGANLSLSTTPDDVYWIWDDGFYYSDDPNKP